MNIPLMKTFAELNLLQEKKARSDVIHKPLLATPVKAVQSDGTKFNNRVQSVPVPNIIRTAPTPPGSKLESLLKQRDRNSITQLVIEPIQGKSEIISRVQESSRKRSRVQENIGEEVGMVDSRRNAKRRKLHFSLMLALPKNFVPLELFCDDETQYDDDDYATSIVIPDQDEPKKRKSRWHSKLLKSKRQKLGTEDIAEWEVLYQ